jgi:SAM-dependent methyltransferase
MPTSSSWSNPIINKQREVAEIDRKHLEILRNNVKEFIRRSGRELDRPGLRLLDIAPQVHEGACPYFPEATIETLDIDPKSGATYIADLCCDNSNIIPSNHFDIIVCTEVLEHTLKPFQAVAELRRMLKPGGLVLVSCPFNLRIHGPLPDCWRFTEHGLRSLFDEAMGFDIVTLDSIEDPERFLMPIHYTLVARKR